MKGRTRAHLHFPPLFEDRERGGEERRRLAV